VEPQAYSVKDFVSNMGNLSPFIDEELRRRDKMQNGGRE